MYGVQLFGKPTTIYHFLIQKNSSSSNLAKNIVILRVT